MKKIIALLLVLVMALSIVGCAAGENTDPTSEPSSEPVSEPAGDTGNTDNTDNTDDTDADDEVTVMTHAEFVAAELDTEVVIETYVQATESWYNGQTHVYAQSEDGGYYIYGLACTEEEAALLVPGTKIRVTGWKIEWSGEVEISDATFEILEGEYIAEATDYTALLGTDELAAHMNELASFENLTVVASTVEGDENEYAFLYSWDGSGTPGESDLYFNVAAGDQVFTFTVNQYMLGTGPDSDVYKTVESLEIGDVISLEGFLYWYNAPQTHITSITVVE